MKTTISMQLINTLQKGINQLGREALSRVKEFVISTQTSNNIYTNKNGQEDIYYTLFGLMLAYLLQIPTDTRKVENYLNNLNTAEMDLIHYAAWTRCYNLLTLIKKGKAATLLMQFRTKDIRPLETFTTLPNGDPLSPYTRFIWYSLLEDTRHPIGNPAIWIQNLQFYSVPTGGYANRHGAVTATINATAAALSVTGQLTTYKTNNNIRYLRDIQDSSGGYRATPHTPAPDLLSTATALFTLRNYKINPAVNPVDFIEAHWLDNGGFAPTLVENTSDTEYTFYGLLALGTCN